MDQADSDNDGVGDVCQSQGYEVVMWGDLLGPYGIIGNYTNEIFSGVTEVSSTEYAFAALKTDGSVHTWGRFGFGSDSSSVRSQLSSGVIEIASTDRAFAALKSDGSVVTWGSSTFGGDSSSVSSELNSGVTKIYSGFGGAFAALKSDGSVVTWGYNSAGGDSSAVSSNLASGVTEIFSTGYAFAALKSDGSVVTWSPSSGGDSSAVSSSLSSGVTEIFSTLDAFAALKSDGSVVTWGSSTSGGNSNSVSSSLASGVTEIFSTDKAFAALKSDGSVVTWGDASYGSDTSSVSPSLASGVTDIVSTHRAFSALKDDGSVITWGSYGGSSRNPVSVVSAPPELGSGVTEIFSNLNAFAAIKADGSVLTWGGYFAGGYSADVSSELSSGVEEIYSTSGYSSWGDCCDAAFAALKSDGSVITWGSSGAGGDSSSISYYLSSGIVEIFSHASAFVALDSDGANVPADGTACDDGDSSTTNDVYTNGVCQGTQTDLPPEVTQVSISPNPIYGTDNADCQFTASDPEGALMGTLVWWTVNGQESTSYLGIDPLPSSYFSAGDVLVCKVRAEDFAGQYSAVVESAPITVSNSPPTISSVALTPTNAYAGDTLVCTASGANDIDGDAITFSYEWFVNGISSGNGATYNGALKDDTVNCLITPYDGTSYGPAVSSNSITIQNTPPVVSGLSFDSDSSGVKTYTTHNCLFTVADADGDATTTTINWYADGILIGTGATITLTPSIISVGQNLQCEVTPNDGTVDGLPVITPINANSMVQNSVPSISSVAIGYSTQQHTSGTFAGDQLTCTPSGGSDLDGDVLTYAYTWYLNGVSHSTTQNLNTTGMSSGDVVYCSAVANDGTDNSAAVNSASTTVYTIHNINIQNMAYSPSSITITQGDILIWTNLDSVDHTVTEDGTSNVNFNSGLISNGQTYTMTGLGVGTYNYYCQPHPSMTGTIIVQ